MKIVIKLKGGIGNQLFQINLGLRLSRLTGLDVHFEVSSFSTDTFGRSPIVKEVLKNIQLVDLSQIQNSEVIELHEANSDGLIEWLITPHVATDLGDVSYLAFDGYWQDSRLIEEPEKRNIRDGLLSHFSGRSEVAETFEKLLTRSKCPVAVHFRRVDYKHHGIAADDFYIRSISWILKRNDGVDLFVFTDEPNYVGYLLQKNHIQFFMVDSGDPISDLYLMTLCKKFIISNSTFSYWGAQLSNQDLVIAPEPWSLAHTPSEFLLPKDWLRVPGAIEMAKTDLPFVERFLEATSNRSGNPPIFNGRLK
jgi:hypothetical protein